MKRKNHLRKPKRITFIRMLSTGMILPILMTIAVWSLGVPLGSTYIKNQCELQNSDDINYFSSQIEHRSYASASMGRSIEFPICLSADKQITTAGINNVPYLLATTYDDPESVSAKWAIDDRGDVVLSNRARMWIILSEEPDTDERRYCSYDPQEFDISELNELFAQFFKDQKSGKVGYEFTINSLYLNKENNKMIPHEIEVKRYELPLFSNLEWDDEKLIDECGLVIDAEQEGFELVTLADRNSPDSFPRGGFDGIWGADPEKFDEIFEQYKRKASSQTVRWGMQMANPEKKNVFDFYGDRIIEFDNEYGVTAITSVIRMNTMNRHAVRKYAIVTVLTFIIPTMLVLVICIIRNVKNKARYAFEDYQRNLINNLAHDIKTPLAIIGGYAENLQELRKADGSEKEQKFISSIIKNVAFTDDIISKTLQLSEYEQRNKPKKTKVNLKLLTDKLMDKYLTVLEERSIELKTTLIGDVLADEEDLSTAIENLISNAVKFTSDNGIIEIIANSKQFSIANDVSENIETKDLMMPFVKGDKARKDKRSHGLGLAIVSSVASQNGFKLKVSCKNRKFTTTIIF